jgi:hypothetical protein
VGRRPVAEPGADTGVGKMPSETGDEEESLAARDVDGGDLEEERDGRRDCVKTEESERTECE